MKIIPQPDALTTPYWEGAQRRELLLQHCRGCGHCWHPPGPICPRCQNSDVEWKPASGRGTVYSFTHVHHAAHAAVNGKLPYLVAVIELAEGPHFVSNLLNCTVDRVAVGLPVHAVFEEVAPGVVLPQFTPDQA